MTKKLVSLKKNLALNNMQWRLKQTRCFLKTACLLFLCFWGLKNSFSQNEYPDWFLNPQKYKGLVIGFSYKGQMPLLDARCMYSIYKRCNVIGNLKNIDCSRNDYNEAYYIKDYKYMFEREDFENVEGKLLYLDGFCPNAITEEFVVAFTTDTLLLYNDMLKQQIIKNNRPKWVNKTAWNKNGYLFGVGTYIGAYNFNDAWKTSEEMAFYNIINFFKTNVNVKTKFSQQNGNETLINQTTIKLNYKLKNLQTLERWIDFEKQIFYTLVKIQQNNIKTNEIMNVEL